jgi:hypothetical protein
MVIEEMAMDTHAITEDVKQNLMKTNTKFKKASNRHNYAKVFKGEDKVMMFLHKTILDGFV